MTASIAPFHSFQDALNTITDAISAAFGDGGLVLSESQALYFAGYSSDIGGIVFARMVADGLVIQCGWGPGGHPQYSL